MKLSSSRSAKELMREIDPLLPKQAARLAAMVGGDEKRVDLVLVDDEEMRRMNREFRGVDRPTDVIAFSYGQAPLPEDDVAGEVCISRQALAKEARRNGVSERDLFLRLVMHGLLHIEGYDHEDPAEAEIMEEEEKRLLAPVLGAEVTARLFCPDHSNPRAG